MILASNCWAHRRPISLNLAAIGSSCSCFGSSSVSNCLCRNRNALPVDAAHPVLSMSAKVIDQLCLFHSTLETRERSMPLKFRMETIDTMEANCKDVDWLIQQQMSKGGNANLIILTQLSPVVTFGRLYSTSLSREIFLIIHNWRWGA